jgi:phosphoribosylformylglycinamidine cyclo-ligase
VLEAAQPAQIDGMPAGERLLAPTRIYARSLLALIEAVDVKGLAHITGGGITENLPRVIPDFLCAEIDLGSWQQGPVFDWLANAGQIGADEMRRTFNCGVGMIAVLHERDAGQAIDILARAGEVAWRMGSIASGPGGVHYH